MLTCECPTDIPFITKSITQNGEFLGDIPQYLIQNNNTYNAITTDI